MTWIGTMASNESSFDVSSELQSLGDPSGRRDSRYWDAWFDIVCRKQNHTRAAPSTTVRRGSTFEWYCTPDEVIRVVKHHFQHQTSVNDTVDSNNSKSTINEECAMIHPGSGTSALPIALSKLFPKSRQVVVDISRVAVAEIQRFHDEEREAYGTVQLKVEPSGEVEYVVADLLISGNANPGATNSTAFLDSTFDFWIDKGFIDAIFSENGSMNELQSKQLFQEANRILKSNAGFVVIITLAEEHSLQIIIDNWLSSKSWQTSLHIWELQPTSGHLPPFAFVFKKSDHNVDDDRLTLHFHPRDCTAAGTETNCSDRAATMDRIHEVVLDSRRRFSSSLAEVKKAESTLPKVMATIEVKTYDAETDLVSIGQTIQDAHWYVNDRSIDVHWQPFTNTDGEEKLYNIVPIGYGISKLQLQCIVENSDLEELVASIEERNDDVVQSVDIDWSKTIPLSNLDKIMRRQRS